MSRTIRITTLLLGFSVTVFSTTFSQELALQEALHLALEQNHDIQVALNRARISESQAQPGNAGLLPRLDLAGGLTLQSVNNSPLAPDGHTTASSAALSASYTLFNGRSNWQQYRQLQLAGESGGWQARQQIELTLLEGAAAYFNITRTSEQLQIMQESLEISAQRLQRLQDAARYGQAGSINLLSARVEMSQDSVSLLQATYSLQQSERHLNLLLNRDPLAEVMVVDGITFAREFDLTRLLVTAVESNPAYRASLLSVETSVLSLAQTRAAYLPRVDLQGSWGYSQNSTDLRFDLSDPTETAALGLNVNLNLFNGGRDRIARQTARLNQENIHLRQEEAQLQLRSQVVGLFQDYDNNQFIIQVQEENLRSADLNFERTLELHSLGQVSGTQMREAQLNLVRARSGLLEARYDTKLSEMQLLQVSGRFSELSVLPTDLLPDRR